MLASNLRRKIKDIQTKLTVHSFRLRVLQPVKTTAQKTLLFTSVFVMSMSALSVLPLNSLVHAAGAYQLTGRVIDHRGNGMQNIRVSATAPGTSTIQFGPTTTNWDGTYSLGIDSGTYDIHFDPASGIIFNPLTEKDYSITGSQALNVRLTPVYHTATGTLVDSSGVPVENALITLESMDGTGHTAGSAYTDALGNFSIQALAGSYNLRAFSGSSAARESLPTGWWNTYGTEVVDISSSDASTGIFRLGEIKTMTVVVKDTAGNPVSGSYIRADGLIHGQRAQDVAGGLVTGTDGIVTFRGFNGNKYSICSGIICIEANLNGDTTASLIMPVYHTATGTLVDSSGVPVENALITLESMDGTGHTAGSAYTDALGNFSIQALAGSYNLRAFSGNNTGGTNLPTGWWNIYGTGVVDINTANVNTGTFQLSPVATMTVVVKDTAGNPVSGSYIRADGLIHGQRAQDVAGGLFTKTDGTVTFKGFSGNKYSICTNNICSEFMLNGDSIANITLPVYHTATGTLLDSSGTPVQNALVILEATDGTGRTAGSTYTDESGSFSIRALADTYNLRAFSGNNTGGTNLPTGWWNTYASGAVDINTNDVDTGIFQLGAVATMTVIVKDYLGNPISDTYIRADGLIHGQRAQDVPGGLVTDASGIVTFEGFNGNRYSICSGRICSEVTLNGNTTLVLRQAPTSPSAPTGLNAASPTQNPSLFWLPSPGASSYNVYRDGAKIASITDPTFVDNDAPEGTRAYHVTAINDGGESDASSSISVVVDRTIPEITFTVSPNQYNGWSNSGPVTVTFNCTDDRSGVQSCTDATTVPLGDGTYIITGTAVDKAGNTNSINAFVSVDTTKPVIPDAAFVPNTKLTTDNTAALGALVSDPLSNNSASGIASVEYYNPVTHVWLPMEKVSYLYRAIFDTPEEQYPAGTYTFQVRTTDIAGNVSTYKNATLVIKNPNQAPVINELTGGTITEGSAYNENGTYSDPESTAWTATVDYGDGSGTQNLPLSGNNFALGHIYQDEGTHTVTVSITDNEGATSTATTTVTVTNTAASISPITTSGNLVLLGSTLTASAAFTDPGATDTHTAVWDWGDGSTPTAGVLTESNGSGSVTGTHTYSTQGVYTITLTLTDNDGAVNTQTFQYIAVYNKGKFAGGDKFNSPIGASIAAPWLSGIATFGISVDNNAQGQVAGTVRMDFDAGNIHLASNTPTILVTTADDHATLRGTGTVNGVSGYTYLVTGFDGKVTKTADTIRFQIKDPSGQVIYDTQMNAPDTDQPTTPLLNPGNGSKADNLVVTYFKN